MRPKAPAAPRWPGPHPVFARQPAVPGALAALGGRPVFRAPPVIGAHPLLGGFPVLGGHSVLDAHLVIGGHPRHTAWREWVDAQPTGDPGRRAHPDDVAMQLYSSGTTVPSPTCPGMAASIMQLLTSV